MKPDTGTTAKVVAAIAAVALVLVAAGCAGVKEIGDVLGATQPGGAAAPGGVVTEPGYEPAPSRYGSKDVAQEESADAASTVSVQSLVIKSKTMRIEVKEVQSAVEQIRTMAAKHGGSISNLQIASDSEGPIYRPETAATGSSVPLRGWVTVRVPAAAFEKFVADVSAIGTVKSQSESTEDVTQQHVDLKARLENLRAEEKRLREFFAAAKNVEEMLAVERELARVRGEIESLDAQVKYLERQAALATVTIELEEPKPVIRPQGESWGFLDAITTGIRGAAATIKVLIVLVLTALPLVVLGLLAFYGLRALVRRRRAKRAASQPQAGGDPASGTTDEVS